MTAAVSVPEVVGLNSMELVQLAPAGSGLVHVDADLMKELALVPVIALDALKVTAAVPVFLMVMVWAAVVVPIGVEANVSEPGVNVRVGLAEPVAVPLRATVCGELAALSTAWSVAVRLPATRGLKVSVMVQEPPAARLAPQVFVSTHEVAFVPVTLMPVSERAAVPELLKVSVAALVAPTAVDP